ncbi:hypothetical protein F5B22DRAFT_175809 [Xylaria bambusicola]|uniref:uncharacterized protein n=1 Tax=Xylaria bambusicola TaxID=326684 RepID=UPI0020085042|nr:uncharacterized protein F5B22DRAFT_175809 [Xylaria bambusicola]KAI0526734.1 hypothetical protein F5B22DRAFT_175809 [Xylaria bambusicola]
MMAVFKLNIILSLAVLSIAFALEHGQTNQHRLGPEKIPVHEIPSFGSHRYRCDQSHALDPSDDGLLSSQDVFSGLDAIDTLVKRHRPLVQIPSICYDDLGDVDDDKRWEPFNKIPNVLKESYPNIHEIATIEIVNKFGLVYQIFGSDEGLAPILLTAHQDVVPVEEATIDRWGYPPFDAFYNETDGFLWGRGASDDKSRITALMSAMEALLSQKDYEPRRSVIFAFGFDEECSGYRGAGEIAKYLEEQHGEGGFAVILDEGGAGLQNLDDTLYALPGVYEKGYLDVWFDLDVIGGHSSVPPPHTAIGMISEIVTGLESSPFEPKIMWESPVHQALICLARYSPYALPDLTNIIYHGDLDAAAHYLAYASSNTQYFIQTSQAVDWIAGGEKINSLPEFVTLGVNHRIAPQDTIGSVQYRVAKLAERVARKYSLQLRAFEDDDDYRRYLAAEGISSEDDKAHHQWKPTYNGTLTLRSGKKSHVTPQTPTSGPIWDIFAGTVRHTFAKEASRVIAAPGAMTANTDSRHYLNLSKHIYRWSPGSLASFGNIHTINERVQLGELSNMAKFYYDFIRNFDQADI